MSVYLGQGTLVNKVSSIENTTMNTNINPVADGSNVQETAKNSLSNLQFSKPTSNPLSHLTAKRPMQRNKRPPSRKFTAAAIETKEMPKVKTKKKDDPKIDLGRDLKKSAESTHDANSTATTPKKTTKSAASGINAGTTGIIQEKPKINIDAPKIAPVESPKVEAKEKSKNEPVSNPPVTTTSKSGTDVITPDAPKSNPIPQTDAPKPVPARPSVSISSPIVAKPISAAPNKPTTSTTKKVATVAGFAFIGALLTALIVAILKNSDNIKRASANVGNEIKAKISSIFKKISTMNYLYTVPKDTLISVLFHKAVKK